MNRTMITLGEVKNTVEAMSRWNHDEMFDVKDIGINELSVITHREKPYRLLENAQRQLCARLGVPYSYMLKCPEFLQRDNMSYWLPQERNEQLFFRLNGADDVRALFTPRYVPLDNFDVVKRLLEIGYMKDTQAFLRIDDGFMSISIPDPESRFVLGNGQDEFMHGINISNSEIGLSSIRIEAWVLRIVCMNGLVARHVTGQFAKRHVISGLVDGLPVLIEQAKQSRTDTEERLLTTMNTRLFDREQTFERFNRQFGLSPKLQMTVQRASTGEEETMFDIISTYTRAAHYTDLTADESYRLEEVGGIILAICKAA